MHVHDNLEQFLIIREIACDGRLKDKFILYFKSNCYIHIGEKWRGNDWAVQNTSTEHKQTNTPQRSINQMGNMASIKTKGVCDNVIAKRKQFLFQRILPIAWCQCCTIITQSYICLQNSPSYTPGIIRLMCTYAVIRFPCHCILH